MEEIFSGWSAAKNLCLVTTTATRSPDRGPLLRERVQCPRALWAGSLRTRARERRHKSGVLAVPHATGARERERNDKQCLERVPLPKCPTECGQGRKASLPGHVPLALASSGPCHCGAISGPCPALQPNFGIRRPWANARTPISSAYKLTQHQWARESHHIGLALAVVLGRRQLCSPPAIFTWRRKSRVGCAPPAKEVDIC